MYHAPFNAVYAHRTRKERSVVVEIRLDLELLGSSINPFTVVSLCNVDSCCEDMDMQIQIPMCKDTVQCALTNVE